MFCLILSVFLSCHFYCSLFIYFSVSLCKYENQTYEVNQSIITANCERKCGCNLSNGTTNVTCRTLCEDGKDPKCDQYSQKIKSYRAPVNGINCTCTKKRCVSGMVIR